MKNLDFVQQSSKFLGIQAQLCNPACLTEVTPSPCVPQTFSKNLHIDFRLQISGTNYWTNTSLSFVFFFRQLQSRCSSTQWWETCVIVTPLGQIQQTWNRSFFEADWDKSPNRPHPPPCTFSSSRVAFGCESYSSFIQPSWKNNVVQVSLCDFLFEYSYNKWALL